MCCPKFSLFLFLCLFSTLSRVPILYSVPQPEPEAIQPLSVTPSTPATIPAFPEQSNIAACPLELPEELFHGVKSACASTKDTGLTGKLRRSRCCPVLATWLYSAYSATALGRAGTATPEAAYDMPLLPDDSETCVDDVGKALKQRGIELARPNQTCDVVYCFCGIRLHPLSCPEAFSVNRKGKLVGDENVKRLERDCLSSRVDVNGFPGLGGCNKCLKTLHLLDKKTSNSSKSSQDRTTKMHNKDCRLMGLTWLLAKNRTAYMHTVSAVIRAMMMSVDGGSDAQSCTLSSDGMPLAVDSSDIYNQSSTIILPVPIHLSVVSLLSVLAFFFVASSSRF